MAKTATASRPCPRCKSPNLVESEQCFSCGCALRPEKSAPAGIGQRILGGLTKGFAFLLVLVLFGLGFWVLSGSGLEVLQAVVQGAPASPPPEETAPPPPPPAAPPVIVLAGPGGTLRLQDGATAMLDLGHDKHRVRVTASVSGDTVSLRTEADGALTATNGESVVLHCPEKRLHRETRGGRLTMSQVPCPVTATVTVRLERPDAAES